MQEGRPLVLITVHRRELSTKGLNSICEAVEGMARDFPQIAFVWPVHLNPCIKDTVTAKLGSIPNILLTAPLEYPVFVFLLDRCHFVLSDSGGIQEEAPSFGKQVLVLREVTERPEAVDAGFCRLLGSDALAIRAAADRLLRAERPIRINAPNPFGDGHAAERNCTKDRDDSWLQQCAVTLNRHKAIMHSFLYNIWGTRYLTNSLPLCRVQKVGRQILPKLRTLRQGGKAAFFPNVEL